MKGLVRMLLRYLKVPPTTYVQQYREGRVVREGAGLSFMYFAPTSVIVQIPLVSRDVPFVFNEVSADFQDATVQGELTYRVNDPGQLAKLLDYSVDSRGKYNSDDPGKINERLVRAVQIRARAFTQQRPIKELLVSSDLLVRDVLDQLRQAAELQGLGVEVLSLSVSSIKGTPELTKALQADAREELLRQADAAIAARRNAAVEQERQIKENEFRTEVVIAEKRRQVRETEMQADIAVEQQRATLVEQRVANQRQEAQAQADALAAMLAPIKDVDWRQLMAVSAGAADPGTLISMAFRDLADNAQRIGELNISSELLQTLMRRNQGPTGKG
jgi:regulator of protease activity HflC (stomatin/prohibitin superfamily)